MSGLPESPAQALNLGVARTHTSNLVTFDTSRKHDSQSAIFVKDFCSIGEFSENYTDLVLL